MDFEWVAVGIAGATSLLGIDPASGRILSVKHSGNTPSGICDVLRAYSDFRETCGIVLPHAVAVGYNGKTPSDPPNPAEDLEVNCEINVEIFEQPK